jgi:hypothetical protein
MSPTPFLTLIAATAIALSLAGPAWSDDDSYAVTITGHRFEPQEFTIPAGKKVTLTVKNLNPTPSEFESADLNREKVVVGGGTVTLFVGPLRPGSYEFFDDFNADTPHGHITAKP